MNNKNYRRQAFFKLIPDLLFVFSAEGTILEYKGDIGELYLAPEFFLHKSVREILPEPIAQLTMDKILAAGQSGEVQNYEYSLEIAGKVKSYEARLLPIENEEVIAIIRDISELRNLREILEKRIKLLTTPETKETEFQLGDIFEIAELQKIQDGFSRATGVASLITLPDGTPVTRSSGLTDFCRKIIRKTKQGLEDCEKSLALLREECCKDSFPQRHCRSAGLWDSGARITVAGKNLGNWLIGQTRDSEQGEQEIKAYLEKIGADVEQGIEEYRVLTSMSREKFENAVAFLKIIVEQLSSLGYQNLRQARYIAERQAAEEELQASYEQIEAGMQQLMAMEEELRIQNEELLSKEKELKDSEEKLQDILNFLPDPTFAINLQGKIILWNRAMERLTGKKAREMLGKNNWEYALPLYGERKPLLIDFALYGYDCLPEELEKYPFMEKEDETFTAENYAAKINQGKGGYLWGHAAPLYDSEGHKVGAIETIKEITEKKRNENLLRERENLLNRIYDILPIGLWFANREGQLVRANPAAVKIWAAEPKVSPKEFGIFKAWRIPSGEEILPGDWALARTIEEKIGITDEMLLIEAFDGKRKVIKNSSLPVLSETGDFEGAIVLNEDITKAFQIEQKLRESEEKYRSLFENIQEGIALHIAVFSKEGEFKDLILYDANPAFERHIGRPLREIQGKRIKEYFGIDNLPHEEKFRRAIETGESETFEFYFQPLEKHYRFSLFTPEKEVLAVLFEDISERKKAEQEISYLSFHDSLTGLYNRRFFEEELQRLDTERNLPLTLIMADVNGLKLTNDAFGHLKGDEVLRLAAKLIKQECRSDEIIARIGGDEFVILLPRTGFSEAELLVERIRRAIARENLEPLELSISFGWASKTEPETDLETLFQKAEDSMYQKKLHESPSVRGNTIKAIIQTMYEKLPGEKEHSDRVASIAELIGRELGYNPEKTNELRTTALMHDIGKITLNEAILQKPGKLNDTEWREIRKHPETGYRILSSVNEMAQLAEYVLSHHENWDGSGYPQGLRGESIPIQARIIRIADSYDAMTSERCYRDPLPPETALAELNKNKGIQFDPELVEVFRKIQKELIQEEGRK